MSGNAITRPTEVNSPQSNFPQADFWLVSTSFLCAACPIVRGNSLVWAAESKGSLPEIAGVWSMVLDTFYLLLVIRASKFQPGYLTFDIFNKWLSIAVEYL
jgi:hypothetical protein